MSVVLLVVQVVGLALVASLVVALAASAVLAVDGRVDVRDVVRIALDDATRDTGRPLLPAAAVEQAPGAGGSVEALRSRFAPPDRPR